MKTPQLAPEPTKALSRETMQAIVQTRYGTVPEQVLRPADASPSTVAPAVRRPAGPGRRPAARGRRPAAPVDARYLP
jgi:hypothetical protein